jgi:hypothetical protein
MRLCPYRKLSFDSAVNTDRAKDIRLYTVLLAGSFGQRRAEDIPQAAILGKA